MRVASSIPWSPDEVLNSDNTVHGDSNPRVILRFELRSSLTIGEPCSVDGVSSWTARYFVYTSWHDDLLTRIVVASNDPGNAKIYRCGTCTRDMPWNHPRNSSALDGDRITKPAWQYVRNRRCMPSSSPPSQREHGNNKMTKIGSGFRGRMNGSSGGTR